MKLAISPSAGILTQRSLSLDSVTPENDDDDDRIDRQNSRFFFLVSSLCRELSPTRTLKWPRRNRVQITSSTSGGHHVEHVACHVVRRDSSAIRFNRV